MVAWEFHGPHLRGSAGIELEESCLIWISSDPSFEEIVDLVKWFPEMVKLSENGVNVESKE